MKIILMHKTYKNDFIILSKKKFFQKAFVKGTTVKIASELAYKNTSSLQHRTCRVSRDLLGRLHFPCAG